MKKVIVRSGLVALFLLVAVQFVPAERSNPPSKLEIPATATVSTVLERSCYDCHSNRTQWPWYSRVAPVSWFVIRHVRMGRENLNLTEWPVLDIESQQYFLGEMKKQIEQGCMPLDSYLLLHRDARLSESDRALLLGWIEEEIALLSGL